MVAFFSCLSLNAVDIEGEYDIYGYDPFRHKTYGGIGRLYKINDIVYVGEFFEDDGDSYKSTGIRTDDQIAFVFIHKDPSQTIKLIGLQNYTITNANEMYGSWIFMDQDRVGTETLKRRK